jgi:hypothetical protein
MILESVLKFGAESQSLVKSFSVSDSGYPLTDPADPSGFFSFFRRAQLKIEQLSEPQKRSSGGCAESAWRRESSSRKK